MSGQAFMGLAGASRAVIRKARLRVHSVFEFPSSPMKSHLLVLLGTLFFSLPLLSEELPSAGPVVYYGIFDTERNPDLIASHAGNGLPSFRFVAEPKRTGTASMELDIDLPDRKAFGRWLFPIPHVRFRDISFWIQTDRLNGAKLELTPTLLGSDQQVFIFKPVIVGGDGGWQRVLLRIPEDVASLRNDPKFAAIGDVPDASLDARAYLIFNFGIRLAKESPAASWSGPLYLNQLEFLQRKP